LAVYIKNVTVVRDGERPLSETEWFQTDVVSIVISPPDADMIYDRLERALFVCGENGVENIVIGFPWRKNIRTAAAVLKQLLITDAKAGGFKNIVITADSKDTLEEVILCKPKPKPNTKRYAAQTAARRQSNSLQTANSDVPDANDPSLWQPTLGMEIIRSEFITQKEITQCSKHRQWFTASRRGTR
jgi:hypothetical protein